MLQGSSKLYKIKDNGACVASADPEPSDFFLTGYNVLEEGEETRDYFQSRMILISFYKFYLMVDMTTSSLKTPLRYPGGKSRACKKMDPFFPDLSDYDEYREPFLGGGSVMHFRNTQT